MTNAELIDALRRLYTVQDTDNIEDWVYGSQQAMCDAADALEAADEKIADCIAAIDALDDSNDAYIKENERLKKRIAELMPKEGEWIKHGCEEEQFEYYECPLCGFIGLNYHYCPNCGCAMGGEKK